MLSFCYHKIKGYNRIKSLGDYSLSKKEKRMSGRKLTQEEKEFRVKLKTKVCKDRLNRWFIDAGLNDSEKDILYRMFMKKQSREAIAMDTYTCKATVSRIATAALNKLMDYVKYSQETTGNNPFALA